MENDDLKNVWSTFNKSLESVEKTNKQILKKMISGKSEFRLQLMKFQSILGILTAPTIIVFVIIPLIINSEKTSYMLIGSVLISAIFIYGFIKAIHYYKLINAIKPAYDPVIKTQERIITLKKFVMNFQKNSNLFFPISSSAFILILWNRINYELPVKVVLLLGIAVGVYFWGKLKYKIYFRDRIEAIEMEMNELREYQAD